MSKYSNERQEAAVREAVQARKRHLANAAEWGKRANKIAARGGNGFPCLSLQRYELALANAA
jgi:hypothetical protein